MNVYVWYVKTMRMTMFMLFYVITIVRYSSYSEGRASNVIVVANSKTSMSSSAIPRREPTTGEKREGRSN